MNIANLRITPANFVHIATGKLEKYYLPLRKYGFEYKHNPLTRGQKSYLINNGFYHISGLTKEQGIFLIELIEFRRRLGLATPQQLQALTLHQTNMSISDKYKRYAEITEEEAEIIISFIQ